MTAPKGTLRVRRNVAARDIPEALRAFFAGEVTDWPWEVLLPHFREMLPARWAAYKAEHPDAKPPRDFEYLDDAEH